MLRVEAKKVLMFNHEPFEDFLDYVPVKQLHSPTSTATRPPSSTPLGWDPDINAPRTTFDVPLTHAHIEQLHHRRADLLDTNLDLLTDISADTTTNATVTADIHANRHSVEALNRIVNTYTNTITN